MRDGALDPDHVTILRLAAESGMRKLFHQGGSTSLAPAASRRRLGVKGFSVFQMAVAKTRLLIAGEGCGGGGVEEEGGGGGCV